ncbi:hypothetical protein GQ53DRAFT_848879 [Thozetella sp. PMI_491]|nr:hypothetical protein GQ53DRAFT_848879 [Thozetella sp. PMI_491]
MAGFWPWKRSNDSPASFEKALSTLSAKIATTQSRLDKTRASSRRVRLLWTLYLGFGYLVYAIVLILVVGWKNMGALEWTGLSGGPPLIYVIRTATSTYFNYRIEALGAKLKGQQEERAKTIQKLKDATKYDSTLELLEKYGGAEAKPKKGGKKGEDDEEGGEETQQGPGPHRGTPSRTTGPPPPTANIQRRDVSQRFSPAAGSPERPVSAGVASEASAEFAPNAFGPYGPPPPNPYPPMKLTPAEAHWYDRILDTLLGEDETAAKNRYVLICHQCRLVNGQAPPGTKTLADVGLWKCMSCGAINGEMDEGKRIVKEVLGEQVDANESFADDGASKGSSDLVEVDKEEVPEPGESSIEVRAESPEPSVRKRRGRKKA